MRTDLDLTTLLYTVYTNKLNKNYNAKPGCGGLCEKRSNVLFIPNFYTDLD